MINKTEMSFLGHLKEFRSLFIRSIIFLAIGFSISYYFYDGIVTFLIKPFEMISGKDQGNLYINSVLEAFFIKIKIAALFGVLISSPVHIYHLLKFVFPALHSKEKKVVLICLLCSFMMVVFGIYYSYEKIIPLSISFLTSTGFIPNHIGLLLSYEKNILFIFQFLVASLIVFQLPVIINILMLLKIIKRSQLIKYHRYINIGILLIAAILTPPDPSSLVMLALPLVILFYLSIFVAKIFNFGGND